MDFLQWIATVFVWFLFFAFLMVLFAIFGDLFRDSQTSGFVKAIWVFFLIFFAPITALVYLIVRGKGMGRRSVQQAEQLRAAQEQYIRSVAGDGAPASPGDQVARAKELLDAGTITQEEFARLKAKALA